MVRITGTTSFDWLDGTPEDDVTLARGRADNIEASLGNDQIDGGPNDDFGEDSMSFSLRGFQLSFSDVPGPDL